MPTTADRWNAYVEQRLATNSRETTEEIEGELLAGNLFEPDEPYVVELARLALDELGFELS